MALLCCSFTFSLNSCISSWGTRYLLKSAALLLESSSFRGRLNATLSLHPPPSLLAILKMVQDFCSWSPLLPNPDLRHVLFPSSQPCVSLSRRLTGTYRIIRMWKCWNLRNNIWRKYCVGLSLKKMPIRRFTRTPRNHTHSHLELNDSIILLCAWRQRLASQIEVVPEVPSGSTSSRVCSLDSAKATGTGLAPMEQEKKRIWCHPIATQTAADSTHGVCQRPCL